MPARPIAKEVISEIKRMLRAGKSPKEIAILTGQSHHNIRVIMFRYKDVQRVSDETYFARYPERTIIPRRIAARLREA